VDHSKTPKHPRNYENVIFELIGKTKKKLPLKIYLTCETTRHRVKKWGIFFHFLLTRKTPITHNYRKKSEIISRVQNSNLRISTYSRNSADDANIEQEAVQIIDIEFRI